MKIEYRYGDILQTDAKYIAHCVNAQHKMASGVAKAIRAAYPKAYNDYMSTTLTLGKVICSRNSPHDILHIVGQDRYGYDGAVYVDYIALRKGINTIGENITAPVAFPMIGCGLAGGNWSIVSEIIEESKVDPIVYVLDDSIKF